MSSSLCTTLAVAFCHSLDRKCDPTSPYVWNLGSQLLALLWKVGNTLGNIARCVSLLKKWSPFCSLVQVSAFCSTQIWEGVIYTATVMDPSTPTLPWWSETKCQNKIFQPKSGLFVWGFVYLFVCCFSNDKDNLTYLLKTLCICECSLGVELMQCLWQVYRK